MTETGGTARSTKSGDLIDIPSRPGGFVRVPLVELERITRELSRLRRHSPVIANLQQQLIALCQRYKE